MPSRRPVSTSHARIRAEPARSAASRAAPVHRDGPHCQSVARDAATVCAGLSPRLTSSSPHRVTRLPRCASSPTDSVTLGSRDNRAGVCAPDAHPAWLSSAASMFHVEHFGSARAVGGCPRRQTAAAGALCAAAPRVAPPATAPRPSMRRLPAAQLRSVNRISLGHAPMPAARDAWDSDSREVRTPT